MHVRVMVMYWHVHLTQGLIIDVVSHILDIMRQLLDPPWRVARAQQTYQLANVFLAHILDAIAVQVAPCCQQHLIQYFARCL